MVRSSTAWGLSLIADGCRRSSTFARLVRQLAGREVVVYVEAVEYLPRPTDGVTVFAGVAGRFRYLRILLRRQQDRPRLIALLGHELQHANEIGDAPGVVDVAGFEALYRHIGRTSTNGYDTQEARDIGAVILDELCARAPSPSADETSRPVRHETPN